MSAPSASRTSPTRRAPDAGGVVLGVFAAVAVAFVVVPLVGAAVTAALPAALAKRFALGASLVTLVLGIAAATPRGLLVPNIKGADQLSLHDLAAALGDLVGTARDGRTPPADLAGGTATITNVGVFGVDTGTPILNPGESGIVCFGAIRRMPWVVGTGASERIEPRWVTTLGVSFDHRLVDGALGSQFLADVAQVLTDPGLSLL